MTHLCLIAIHLRLIDTLRSPYIARRRWAQSFCMSSSAFFLTVLVALDDRLEKLFFSAESVTQDRILGKALLAISVYKKGSYPIKRVRDYITLSGGQEMKASYQEGKKLRRPKQI